MICDITSIPAELLQQPDGLLVLRMPEATQSDIRQIDQMVKDLRPLCHPRLSFVVLMNESTLTHDTLEAMAKRVGLCLCTSEERATLDALP